MKMRRPQSIFFGMLLIVALLTGCLGGGSSTPKSYTLKIRVINEANGTPIVGAQVEVTGKSLNAKATDVNGIANFTGLSGKIELLVQAAGFKKHVQELIINANKDVVIRLPFDESVVLVSDEAELVEAIHDPNTNSIFLESDITLSENLVIERLVDLNLNGKTVIGDIRYNTDATGTINLSGTGQISGSIFINTPHATISNYMKVANEIVLESVANETWNEYLCSNRIIIDVPYITVNLFHGATLLRLTENAGDNTITIQGPVATFEAYAGAYVTGANNIALAVVNTNGVIFDLYPIDLQGDCDPIILQPFEPGSGGRIPAFSPSVLPANTFAGLYVERSERRTWYGSSTRAQADFSCVTPASLGGDGYAIQYSLDQGRTWEDWKQNDEPLVIDDPNLDNFGLIYVVNGLYRLKMIGGPLDGYTSNEVDVTSSVVHSYFTYWGYNSDGPAYFVGSPVEAVILADKYLEGDVSEHLSFQWYHLDPVTYEMNKIDGQTSRNYITSPVDAGYILLARAQGDDINVGGFAQIILGPMLLPNKAFISNVTSHGFTLNLQKSVPNLTAKELKLEYNTSSSSYGTGTITAVTPIGASKSQFLVEVELPADTNYLVLESMSPNWSVASEHYGQLHPYIFYNVINF